MPITVRKAGSIEQDTRGNSKLQQTVNELENEIGQLNDPREVSMRASRRLPNGYLIFRRGRHRVIGRLKDVNFRGQDIPVVWLLRAFDRGSSHQQYLNTCEQIQEQDLPPHRDVSALQQQLEVSQIPQPPSEQLTDYSAWAQPLGPVLPLSYKQIVLESRAWVEAVKSEEIVHRYYSLCSMVDRTFHDDTRDAPYTDFPGIHRIQEQDLCLLYARTSSLIQERNSVDLVFLCYVYIIGHQPDDLIQKLRDTCPNELLLGQADQLEWDEIARYALRAYPSYCACDVDVWAEIEKEPESERNLALSSEELRVLQQAFLPAGNEAGLPVFISGRAGSGKSTMLYHLFSAYCYRWLTEANQLEGRPLFVTYSPKLRDAAQQTVNELLRARLKVEKTEAELSMLSDNLKEVNELFSSFHELSLKLLSDQEQRRFPPDKYISWSKFQRLYEGSGRNAEEHSIQCRLTSQQKRGISADLAWHVIRAYIKGYFCDSYMEPDEYQEIGRKNQTVDEDTFKRVYEVAWQQWYQRLTEEEGYWDDQDLARAVHCAVAHVQERWPVIFCDEAQDLTRIEFELLTRLFAFSGFDVRHVILQALPLALAGDPYQTVNPTGFRFDQIRAMFVESVLRQLDPTNKHREWQLRPIELTSNYRSEARIVKAANTILLWRMACMEEDAWDTVKFQQPWQEEDPTWVGPQWFDLTTMPPNFDWEALLDATATAVVVPVEADELEEFVKGDTLQDGQSGLLQCLLRRRNPQLLSRIAAATGQVDDRKVQDTLGDVWSPTAIKGLECPQVIVYRFAERCPQELLNDVDGIRNDPAKRVAAEYFLNRLYVAASRAKIRLWFFDAAPPDENDTQFLWRHARDDEIITGLANTIGVQTAPDCQPPWVCITQGNWQDLVAATTRDTNAVRMWADQLKTEGETKNDAQLLRRATVYYRKANDEGMATLCEAAALELEEKYEQAGDIYLSINQQDRAGECYWRGFCWQKLWPLLGGTAGGAQYQITQYMVSARPTEKPTLLRFAEWLANPENEVRRHRQLEKAAARFTTDATTALQSLNQDEKHTLAKALERLGDLGFDTWATAGHAYYQANDYEGAERCWRRCLPAPPEEYWEVGYKRRRGVDGLEWLLRNGAPGEQVVEGWREAGDGGVRLSDLSLAEPLAKALMDEKLFAEAVGALLDSGGIASAVDAIKAWWRQLRDAKSGDIEEYEQCLAEAVKKYLEQDNYEEAASIAQDCVPDTTDAKWRLAKAICAVLVRSTREPDLRNPHRQLAQFVWNAVASLRDHRTVVVEVVGPALERTGALDVSEEFYKAVEEWSTSEKRKQFAQARRLAVKHKKLKSEAAPQSQIDELRREAKQQGLALEDLPDYPDVKALQPSIEIDTTMASPRIDDRSDTMAKLVFLGITILADADAAQVRLMKDLDKPGGFGVFIDASNLDQSTTTGRGIQTTKVRGQIDFSLPNAIIVTARRRHFETEVIIRGAKGILRLYVMKAMT